MHPFRPFVHRREVRKFSHLHPRGAGRRIASSIPQRTTMPRQPHHPVIPFLSAAALALCAACGSSDETAGTEGGAWRSGQEWRLVKEAQIGSADGEGPAMFASIVGVLVDPLDRVWVADGQQQEVRVFDARGNHVRTVGRKGGGPEEFGMIAGMDWGPDGNVWVLDGGNSRYAVWDTAGKLVTTHRRNSNMLMIPWPGGIDAQGQIYDTGGSLSEDSGERVVRYGPDLQPRDTFVVPPFKGEQWEVVNESGGRGGRRGRSIMTVSVPFTGSQVWRVDPRGNVWVARTQQYRLERRAFDGTAPDLVVERPAPPVKVAPEDLQRSLDRFKDFKDRGGQIDESRIPDTYPALLSFFFQDDGHMWVFPQLGPERPALDVFDPAGRFLGRVTPPGLVLPTPEPAIRGNRFVGVVRDENDVETVWVMRLEKP